MILLERFTIRFYTITSCVQYIFIFVHFRAFGTTTALMIPTTTTTTRCTSCSWRKSYPHQETNNKVYHEAHNNHQLQQINSQSQPQPQSSPRTKSLEHVAIICDGNSRWAASAAPSSSSSITSSSGINTLHGHARGASRVTSLLKYIHENYSDTIHYVTLYGFSSENWSRPPHEIRDIWKVMEETAESVKEWVQEEYLIVKILGDLSDHRVPYSLRQTLLALVEGGTAAKSTTHAQNASKEEETNKKTLTLCLAINYGGRNDILNATRKIAEMVERGEITSKDIHNDSDVMDKLLCTAGVPDPDLVIRTGGEQRLSNFLIWNIAYSELYFTPILWPDFDENQFELALDWYYGRERRYGGRSDKNTHRFK